ncbi:c-type cytochrome [Rhodocaloribacter sp.]
MNPNEAKPTPSADERPDAPMQGHSYDGIQEYDNPMPGWWVWIFWATVLFTPFYILGVHVFGYIDTYQEDLAQSEEELARIRAAYAEAHPSLEVDEASLQQYVEDPAMAAAGAPLFAANCASCHGAEGQGLIGPNLTDKYWIHGNTNVDLFNVITKGVLEKGMPPWESVFSVEERAQLVAFIRSLEGTNPPDAKEPQGELYE